MDNDSRAGGMMALRGTSVLAAALLGAFSVATSEARTHVEGRTTVPSIVARALPAVVSITTRQIERDQFNQSVPTRGLGSGFIVDPGGYVLTNLHVVQGAEDIKVTLTGGQSFRARLVGGDRFSELAVLKIDGTKLPTLRLGDSTKLAVGALSDLQACAAQAGGAGRPSAGEVVAGRIGGVGGTDSTQIRPHSPKSQDLEAQVSICLAARGYTAGPSPSGQ